MSSPLRVGPGEPLSIVLIGISHRTAPVELREKLALLEHEQETLLNALTAEDAHEAVLVSTCNRLELYAVTADAERLTDRLTDLISRMRGLDPAPLRDAIYLSTERDAIRHLQRVACGLDSMVLGEPQILGQVSNAVTAARLVGAARTILSRLFDSALHAGKRARRETEIGSHTVSIAHAGAVLAEAHLGDFENLDAVVVGAGEMAAAAVHALHVRGLTRITIVSRTFDRARDLASRFGAEAKLWDQLETTIAGADLLVTATSAPDPVIGRALVSTAMSGRLDRPLLSMDIALPRDVDPRAGGLPGVSLLDIDDLQDVVDGTIAHRRSQVPAVERIVTEEMAAFEAWLRVRQAAPIISRMRRRVEDIGRGELEKAVSRLGDLDGRERLVMERMVHSIVQKVLHEPTVGLREHVVNDEGPQCPWYIRELHDASLPSGSDKP